MRKKMVSSLPGDLKETKSAVPENKTVNEFTTDVEIKNIQHDDRLPDYRRATHSRYPILIQTPEGIFCIEGQEQIEKAREKGESSIFAKIYEINCHSMSEIAIRILMSRMRTEGGYTSYVEILRNIIILVLLLQVEYPYTVFFSHGGSRRGKKVEGATTEISLAKLIADRCGVALKTAQQYCQYAEYVAPEMLTQLIDEHYKHYREEDGDEGDARLPGKIFFQKIQTLKTRLINEMRATKTPNEEMSARVTKQIFEFWIEYRENGKISSRTTASPSTETPVEVTKDEDAVYITIDDEEAEKPKKSIVYKTLKPVGITSAQKIIDLLQEETPTIELAQQLQAEIQKLTDLFSQISFLLKGDGGTVARRKAA